MHTQEKALSPELNEELVKFFEVHPPRRVSRNLRRVLLDYLRDQLETGSPLFIDELLWDMYDLFDLLDIATTETRGWHHPREFDKEDLYEAGNEYKPDALTQTIGAVINANVEDNALTTLINFIVTAIQPQQIFLLHPAPNAAIDNSTYIDLLIVIADKCNASFSEYETLIKLGCINQKEVNFTLHQANYINKQIAEGHIFYSLVCTTKNLVYTNGAELVTPAPALNNPAIKQKAINDFATGYIRAQSFLKGAKQQIENGENATVAFMLHQAAELTLRAFIFALMGFDARTHSIELLKKHSRRCMPQVNELLPAGDEDEAQLLKVLDKAYLGARYASNYSIDDKLLDALLKKVTTLLALAKDTFNAKMKLFTV
jgi:HEPN domain-containing protein